MASAVYDFDQIIDRRAIANLNQWNWHPDDVLPLWVADMSFRTPQPVLDALQSALDHSILGYEIVNLSLLEVVARRLERLYGWVVLPDMVVPVPGVGMALSVAAEAVCQPGDGILVQPPVFHHFINFPQQFGFVRQDAPLRRVDRDGGLHYEMDFDSISSALHSGGAETRMLLLCNPHNPVGRAWAAAELRSLAAFCAEHTLILCSDEVHSELLLGGARHAPVAALAPDLAEQTITLLGPGKAFNMSGLHCAFAIIPQADLRRRFKADLDRRVLHINSLGLRAARAAYSGACDSWLAEACAYLTANRDFVVAYVQAELPGIRTTRPEATYLAWLDCSELIRAGRIPKPPHEYFLETAKVALHEGPAFGAGGQGCVRLTLACPRAILEQALERIRKALAP